MLKQTPQAVLNESPSKWVTCLGCMVTRSRTGSQNDGCPVTTQVRTMMLSRWPMVLTV